MKRVLLFVLLYAMSLDATSQPDVASLRQEYVACVTRTMQSVVPVAAAFENAVYTSFLACYRARTQLAEAMAKTPAAYAIEDVDRALVWHLVSLRRHK